MRRKLLLTLALFFLLYGSYVSAQDVSSGGEHIENFKTDIVVGKDGKITVSETIVYDFDGLDRHGIFRDIPYIKTNKDGKKFRLDFTDFSVENENGQSYQYKKTTDVSNGQIQLKIGNPDKTITGVHTYVIKYKVAGALTYFSDHDELYWNATGNNWQVPIVKTSVKIMLPTAVDETKLSLICYTGPRGSTVQECTGSVKDGVAIFADKKSFSAGEGMTIVLGFPKNLVSVLEPKPYIPFWQSWLGRILSAVILFTLVCLAIFWYLVYPIWIIYKWYKYGRDPSTHFARSGQVRAWYDPPKSTSGRALTPAEVGTLIDETVQQRDISAMIVDLARRGYFQIEERKKKDFYFVQLSPTSHKASSDKGGLLPFERLFLEKVFDEKNEVRLKDETLFSTVEAIKGSLYNQLVSDGLFPKNPQSIRSFYVAIGIIALVTFNIFLFVVSLIFGRAMPRKTSFGAEAANLAKSLRNFLSSQERQLAFQAKNQMMFEKLLAFAVAFGVEKIWADRFKDIQLREPDWYVGYQGGSFNSTSFANSLNSSFSSFARSATPTTSSSGFSSGFSGGSSGGGGGGGGGGSW